ncbi:unnamed protein product [Urochloa humidicola]
MKPLSEEDSKKLFFDRLFGSAEACPSSELKNASCEMLKKCGGLPLAIITIASMLACQPTKLEEQLEYIRNSLSSKFTTDFNYKNMMYILDLSYKNLPRHLKACFLYLGSYPEDRKIDRAELVRRWVAEGFVSYSSGQDIWDVAKSYFNELVNRSMIQPIYDKIILGIIKGCRVHDMLLELIIRRCKEDNFLSLVNDLQAVVEVQDKVIRRLNIVSIQDKKGGENLVGVTLSKIRSLTILGESNWIPSLLDFKFVRVLSVYCCHQMEIDLNVINQLSQLRYVKVDGLGKLMLPCQIQGLQLLETLDLFARRYGHGSGISLEIDDAPCLSHLIMPFNSRLPDWIGRIKSLRALSPVSLPEDSLEGIVGLGELTALSDLSLRFPKWCAGSSSATWMAALSTSLNKLGNLKRLWVYHDDSVYWCCDALSSLSPPFLKIERLELYPCTFSRVPRWISCLRSLHDLWLGAKQVLQEDVDVIGTKLPSLRHLELRIPGIPTGRVVIGGSTGFPCLKKFYFDCDGMSFLTFEAGAMPVLRLLELRFDADRWDKAAPAGFRHLPASLEKIKIYDSDAPPIRTVFQEAADALPTRPELFLILIPSRLREEDDY